MAERRGAAVGTLFSRLTGRRERVLDAMDRPGEIELQASGVRVVMVPAWGGRITVLELGGRQWLSPSAPPAEGPERRELDVALAGGYQEAFPTVLPCRVLSKHTGVAFEQPALGELHRLVPTTAIATLPGSVEATLAWTGDRMPYRFVRVVSGVCAVALGALVAALAVYVMSPGGGRPGAPARPSRQPLATALD